MIKNIIFNYPSRVLGGAEILYINCAKFLSRNSNYTIYYIDFEDGFSHSILDSFRIKYINVSSLRDCVEVPDNSISILGIEQLFRASQLFQNKTIKYLFWGINPYSIINLLEIDHYSQTWKIENKYIAKGFKFLTEKSIIFYMDYSTYIAPAKFFGYSAKKIFYIPVSVDNNNFIESEPSIPEDGIINFLWLGRLDKDKSCAIYTMLNDIQYYAHKSLNRIKLTFIGSGNIEEDLKMKEYDFDLEFLGQLTGDLLYSAIDKCDIGIAMGTSALEIAKRKKPVIITGFMPDVKESNSTLYFTINHTYNYTLVNSVSSMIEQSRYFTDLVNNILDNYIDTCLSCSSYVKTNYKLRNTCDLLINLIEKMEKDESIQDLRLINRLGFVLRFIRRRVLLLNIIKKRL